MRVRRMGRQTLATRMGPIQITRVMPWTQGIAPRVLHQMLTFHHHRCLHAPFLEERLREAQRSVDAFPNELWVLIHTVCMSEGA